jgi:hypothetical protein
MRLHRLDRLAIALVLGLALIGLAGPGLDAQRRPSNVIELTRHGLQRGTTVAITIVGINLAGATAIVTDDPRITARITGYTAIGPDRPRRAATDTGAPISDEAERGELAIELSAAPDAPAGRHLLRVRTPLGTTPARVIEVGELAEIVETEPNDERGGAAALPVTINGETGWPGDVDRHRFTVAAGTELVCVARSAALGSRLDARLTLRGPDGTVVAANDDESDATRDPLIVYAAGAGGTYELEIADAAGSGGTNTPYRLTLGSLPYVTSVFPLGGLRDAEATVAVAGANLGPDGRVSAKVLLSLPPADRAKGLPPPALHADLLPTTLVVGGRPALNEITLARGADPEVMEDATAAGPLGQLVSGPVTINGRIEARADGTAADTFRIRARKGEQVVLSVMAARLGSPLDAALDVLDVRGRAVPRAVLRPVWQTSVDLRDRGSQDPGLRFLAWSEIRRGDHVFVDRELMRVRELPKGPDEDVQLMAYRGRRLSYEGTSGEGHALNRPIYKVEIHPPGTTFSPNGLPTFELAYGNDDGGPFYGKDPYVLFTAPAAGEYLVRVRDARGVAGATSAYRLAIGPPRPDFTLAVAPANPNVPRGGRVLMNVFAFRHDGFDGPIEVEVTGLPAGYTASKGTVLPGHMQVALAIEAADDAPEATAGFGVRGRAQAGAIAIERHADLTRSLARASTAAAAPLRILSVQPATIELRPGESANVSVMIERAAGFAKRVPLNVANLPLFATIPDIGLNGILITEAQDRRTFTIQADAGATPLEQTLYVTARAETLGSEPVEVASTPLTLRILPARAEPSGAPQP